MMSKLSNTPTVHLAFRLKSFGGGKFSRRMKQIRRRQPSGPVQQVLTVGFYSRRELNGDLLNIAFPYLRSHDSSHQQPQAKVVFSV